jgi:hypothetical protein
MITEFVTSAKKNSSSSSSLQTSVIVKQESVCVQNLPKQASVGKVCIYVCSKHESLTKFSFAKHPKEKEKQGFVPKPDEQVPHHRTMTSLPSLSQVQTSAGWVSSWNPGTYMDCY